MDTAASYLKKSTQGADVEEGTATVWDDSLTITGPNAEKNAQDLDLTGELAESDRVFAETLKMMKKYSGI